MRPVNSERCEQAFVNSKNTLGSTNSLLESANGLVVHDFVVLIGTLIETCVVGHLQLRGFEAGVPRHDGSLRVIKADLRSILEGVVDELGTVRLLDFDALLASDDCVLSEHVIIGPPGLTHFRIVRSNVREGVEPEEGRCNKRSFGQETTLR